MISKVSLFLSSFRNCYKGKIKNVLVSMIFGRFCITTSKKVIFELWCNDISHDNSKGFILALIIR